MCGGVVGVPELPQRRGGALAKSALVELSSNCAPQLSWSHSLDLCQLKMVSWQLNYESIPT